MHFQRWCCKPFRATSHTLEDEVNLSSFVSLVHWMANSVFITFFDLQMILPHYYKDGLNKDPACPHRLCLSSLSSVTPIDSVTSDYTLILVRCLWTSCHIHYFIKLLLAHTLCTSDYERRPNQPLRIKCGDNGTTYTIFFLLLVVVPIDLGYWGQEHRPDKAITMSVWGVFHWVVTTW